MIRISAIIPTYNRRDLVIRAIETALAQTVPIDEIIVVDDGSSDGTGDALHARYGERIRYVWQANAGVSAARNHGMRLARGRYFALLDSDDEWLPEKTARQLALLQARPDLGMALCDVQRVDAAGNAIDILRRRDTIREDGPALRWVIHNPALAPASAMFLREVFEDIGGFDESLRTAEDIDFHLRVARRWPIGVVEAPLVRAMRGHDGLSADPGTYDDYVRVVERAIAGARGVLDDQDLDRALASTYARNARGMLIRGRWSDAMRLIRRSWGLTQDREVRRELLRLLPFAARRALRGMLPR
ncbi:glycosyltransferase family 2 protein [Pseudoxanthomonas helianthi]|uniref:Glycosyltransferase family 2 protein n=1 Tax=Pseudoxanthomonas helianthi TaxID=1453541 RepID=A0A940XBA5_9GAMM|nr:glycosyltransferase family 2 protein [Pseudoxanthomonas helianthi]